MSKSILINLSMVFHRPTGIATYALNVARHLDALNPILLTPEAIADFASYNIPSNMTPADGTKGHLRRLWWTQWQLPKLYRKLKASLIYSPIPEAPLYSGCPYVVMCHDLIPLRFPRGTSPLTNYFRAIVPLVLHQAEHIICNSEATARDLVDFYGIAPQKISPVLLAYDNTHFYPRSLDRNIANVDLDCPYFLYLGRHDPYKNVSGLISAFAKMPYSQDYRLYLAGAEDPRFTPKLKQQAAELGLGDRVFFLDYVSYEDLPLLLSRAIALVFPTFWEGFGLPVLEAMACGTPVITSNLASLPEVTGDAAVLVNPYSTKEITQAMEYLATDSIARSQLSQLSLKRAELFSWKKTGAQTQAILQRYC